jgi:hypothetical protein
VKYIVANEDSFFYQLVAQRQLRNELAARGIYIRDDMPEFSLQRLDEPALVNLGIPPNIIALLGPSGGHGVAGFEAALYQDFITGEDHYVLTFRGTDDDVWAGEWSDWINNIAQGLGRYAPQYTAAMEVAFQLSNNAPGIPIGHLITSGHSLGGSLASAASMAGGIPAHTFNAAGLHLDTLYQRDANGNPIPNGMGGYVELYAGSVARYNNASAFVTAYFVDYDLLSAVQDFTPIPNAIGNRIELDGPFDVVMTSNAVVFATAIAGGHGWAGTFAALVAGATMVESHDHPSLLYGLLVVENALGNIVFDTLGYGIYFP